MKNLQNLLICVSTFVSLNFLFCMDRDPEIGKTSEAPAAVESAAPQPRLSTVPKLLVISSPDRLTEDKKTDSGGVVIDLGSEKFNTFRLSNYYHQESKTLDLSHKPLGDLGLKAIFVHIKHFIEQFDVENLLLESIRLSEIPYYLITYALVNNKLKIVSLQNNDFKIPGLLPAVSGAGASSLTQSSQKRHSGKRTSFSGVFAQVNAAGGNVPHASGLDLVSSLVTTLWADISPEIEKELEEQNLSKESLPLFKKIIFIDKRIPPITIFDRTQTLEPEVPSNCSRFKSIVEKALFAIAGGIIGFLPQIVALAQSNPGSCDMSTLNKMLEACNASSH